MNEDDTQTNEQAETQTEPEKKRTGEDPFTRLFMKWRRRRNRPVDRMIRHWEHYKPKFEER